MALDTAVIDVGSTEVLIDTDIGVPTSRHIRNIGTFPVFLGPTGVTPETGFVLFPGDEDQALYLWTQTVNEVMYVIAAPGASSKLHVLETS